MFVVHGPVISGAWSRVNEVIVPWERLKPRSKLLDKAVGTLITIIGGRSTVSRATALVMLPYGLVTMTWWLPLTERVQPFTVLAPCLHERPRTP